MVEQRSPKPLVGVRFPHRPHGKSKSPFRGFLILLFLGFLEDHVLAELCAVLLELYLSGNELAILARPIHLSGGCVFEHYELVLRHSWSTIPKTPL